MQRLKAGTDTLCNTEFMQQDFKYFAACALSLFAISAFAKGPTLGEVLAAAPAADWRTPDPENTLYMDLPTGRVIIELAPAFAPLHVRNIKTLARAKFFDGLAVVREQDNYVAQWGDPDNRHPIPPAVAAKVAPEFDMPLPAQMPFTPLPDGDVYAPQVGFSQGFPVARSSTLGKAWLAHCYAMVGVGRDMDAQSGTGAELYAVIGHSPRNLDRNVALVGRVLQGMELLSGLPRGGAEMGFYTKEQATLPIKSIRVAADVPAAERVNLEVLKTDSASFVKAVESRRNRTEEFFFVPAGKIDLCNAPLPVRVRPAH